MKLYGVLENRKYIVMVLEYCAENSLVQMMANSPKECLPEDQAKKYLYELVKVFAKMHALGFVHRDIMLSNIFVREG